MDNMNDDFELYDFIADANFDQFVDLIRGENEDQVATSFAYADDLINGSFAHNISPNNHHFPGASINPETNNNIIINDTNAFNFGDAFNASPPNPNTTLFSSDHRDALLPGFDGEIVMGGDDEDEENEDEDSSGTTTTTNTTTNTKRPKVDRSRTLISERRRRGRMKEKLYALRSLVPNITKMDKASIVGDAVLYVEDLQSQAKKLKAEIESLEASLEEAERYQLGSTDQTVKKTKASKATSSVLVKTIIQMDMFQVEERGFYVKVVCNNGEGTAVSLYKALESLTSFNVHSSNLATANSDRYVLTFTLNVKECEQEQINLPNLKLWVTGAFLNQGFELN